MTRGAAFQAMTEAMPTTFEGLLRAGQVPPPVLMRLVLQGQDAGVLAPVAHRPSETHRCGASQMYGLAVGGREKLPAFVAELETEGPKR